MHTDQKELECSPSQQVRDREAYATEGPGHMAIKVFEISKEQRPRAREAQADESLEKGRLAQVLWKI